MINQYINNNKKIFNLIIKNKYFKNNYINYNQIFIIINVINFYNEYKISPSIKMIIFYIKEKFGKKYGNIEYIKSNFKNLNLIYKISGLKRNNNCFLN